MSRATDAIEIFEEALAGAKSPGILFSGGKESIVLHHLVGEREIPHLVLYDEIQPERLAFIEELFKERPFFILNFLPCLRSLVPTTAGVDLVNVYDLRGQGILEIVLSPIHADGLCVFDWLGMPTRSCPDFSFDVLIAGGRKTDLHDYYGNPFRPRHALGAIQLVNPLYNWSTEDVWDYIHRHKLSFDIERYSADTSAHLDSLSICTRCCTETGQVFCPKYQKEINAAEMRQEKIGLKASVGSP